MTRKIKKFIKQYVKDCIKQEWDIDELYYSKEYFVENWTNCIMPDLKFEVFEELGRDLDEVTDAEVDEMVEIITPIIMEAAEEEYEKLVKKYL